LLLVAVAVNIALALLPTYDAFNLRCWISVGSSLTGALPAMASNPWPGGFFSFMFFAPLYASYVSSGFNLYLSVVILKLVLFVFTLLTAFLLYRITQKAKPAYAQTVLLFTLLNPAVLYINYFWVQVDMLPVFFFILGYTLLRYVDFGGNCKKRYAIAFVPLLISAFIYRYTLILIPALIFFEQGNLRHKLSACAIALGEVVVFFGLEFVFFRGGFYNYIGALSGAVINMSGVQGLQYWLPLPLSVYLLFLVTLAVAAPLLLKRLRFGEPAVLFFVLLLFIYTSAVPLPDYFLWLYPLSVLVALSAASKRQFNRYLLITNLPLFLGLFFISFIVGNGVQAGPFYFAYPLLHLDLAFFTTPQTYSAWVLLFNLFLLVSVVATAAFCLYKPPRVSSGADSWGPWVWRWNQTFKPKKSALLAGTILLLLVLGFGFNAVFSAPVTASQQQVFPLCLFPSEGIYDSSPMFGTYYLSWAGRVVFNDWSQPVSFNHSLTQQSVDLNLTFNLNTSRYATYTLLQTDSLSAGVTVEPRLALSDLSELTPYSSSESTQWADVSVFDAKVPTYAVYAGSHLTYNLDASSSGQSYILAYQLQNATADRIQLYFRNPQCIIQLSLWGSHVALASYDFASQSIHYAATTYSRIAGGWNLLEFAPNYNGLFCWVNDTPLTLQGSYFRSDTSLMLTSDFGEADYGAAAVVSGLFYSSTHPVAEVARTFFVADAGGGGFTASLTSTNVTFAFTGTPQSCTVTQGDRIYVGAAADSVAFGKLSAGVYGFSFRLNQLTLTQNAAGYYLLPVYLAASIPFAVALLSLPLITKKPPEAT
jgi:hypothetical protein